MGDTVEITTKYIIRKEGDIGEIIKDKGIIQLKGENLQRTINSIKVEYRELMRRDPEEHVYVLRHTRDYKMNDIVRIEKWKKRSEVEFF